MKRILFGMLMLATMLVTFTSCDKSAASKVMLQKQIEETQKRLPMSMGAMGTMSTITYNDDVVTFTYILNERLSDIKVLMDDSLLIKENFQCLVARNNAMQQMVKEIASAEANLRLKYKGRTSGKVATVTISNSELADTENFIFTPEQAAQKLVENCVNIEKKKIPVNNLNGSHTTDEFWEDNTLVYVITFKKGYSIKAFEANKSNIHTQMRMALASQTAAQSFIEAMISLNKSICYRIKVEDSEGNVDITFSPSELKTVFARMGKIK